MRTTILGNPIMALVMSFLCFAVLHADEIVSDCGPQRSPEETWESWRETFVSGEWIRWYACHSKGAQAALFLNSALSTANSEGKARVIDKYGKCESRSRPSLECITEETAPSFFHEMTILDEESSRTRLSKIWKKEGVRIDGAILESIVQHDENHATGKIQSNRSDGEIENWTISFVRVHSQWFVTFEWGM